MTARAREWAIRLSALGLFAAIAIVACLGALGNAMLIQDPSGAAAVDPFSARGRAAAAETRYVRIAASASADDLARFEADGLAALRSEPLYTPALGLLGYLADARGDSARALSLIVHADGISRRDLFVRLWRIQHDVNRGNVDAALAGYALALTGILESRGILSGRLMLALDEPQVARAFQRYVSKPSPWLPEFLNFAADNSKDLRSIAKVIIAAGGLPSGAIYREREQRLLHQLAVQRHYLDVAQFYLATRGAFPDNLRRVTMDDRSTDGGFSPVTWRGLEAPGISVDVEQGVGPHSRQFHLAVAARESGAVLAKLLKLAPGMYELRYVLAGDDKASESAKAYWRLLCVADQQERESWQQQEQMPGIGARKTGSFRIAGDCATQLLEFIVYGGDADSGLNVTLSQLSLEHDG